MEQSTYTFLVLAVTIGLFIWGRIRADLVAVISMMSLFLGGVISTQQTLSGFSNSTVVMIAALFVVGEGLSRTGVTSWMSRQIILLAGSSNSRIIVVLMLGTALLSAFISNTGTVATLLPAVIAVAWSIDSLPSKLLIPLAFAANSGGLLTLTGTPPNIVVSDALISAGYAPFGFFEYAYIGLPLLVVAIIYMVCVGSKLLPTHNSGIRPMDLDGSINGMAKTFSLDGKIYIVHLHASSSLIGKTLDHIELGKSYGVSVLRIDRAEAAENKNSFMERSAMLSRLRKSKTVLTPDKYSEIKGGDILLLKGSAQAIELAADELFFEAELVDLRKEGLTDLLMSTEVGMAEVLITPRSLYIGKTLQQSSLAEKFGVQIISILRGNGVVAIKDNKLEYGDALLLRGAWRKIELLRRETDNFTVVGSPDDLSRQLFTLNWKALLAVVNLVGMVVLMVTGLVPTVIAALIAAIGMVLCGCLDMSQAYRSIGWQSVILISAMIPLSIALENSGGANLVAGGLVKSFGTISPIALMAGIFLLTSGFSQVINNTATAVLMAPIVLQAAEVSAISPYPLLITVSISASTAFLTPIGTTTNLMVMTPGGYSFKDYVKVGAPLMIIFMLVSLVIVPLIWPFQ